jgi:3-(3-hydroxy-phenyl)propionate hydroxylase
VRKVLATFVDVDAVELWRIAVYRFHALVAKRWKDGRVFLMGDAAHQMPPFLGQGLCAGIRDALNLAWKLDAVLRCGLDEHLLDSYGEEREPHVRTVVAHARAFGLIIGELDPDAALARDQQLGEELAAGRSETVRQKFIPDLTSGLVARDANGQPLEGAGTLIVAAGKALGATQCGRIEAGRMAELLEDRGGMARPRDVGDGARG